MEPLVTAPALMAPHAVPTIALSALLALAMLTAAALKGWQGWLSLKSRELDLRAGPAAHAPHDASYEPDVGPATVARIELADLKERIRKLEAIASGVDL
ncbi:hypothetical protein [Novosphingobium terrae]|jgi:hypothetical protein|uniref:hypothetical protein n=1 Tax=Novosphingobium terrae TaxID=2726189 RepID=UPI001F138A28|nr:hypothetical protein [Novosphingobium terrae]